MFDFLANQYAPAVALPVTIVLARLLAASLGGAIVAAIYIWYRRGFKLTFSFPLTLALLSVLIAMVTLVVGDNAARAFSLAGALSIVRFRTVVQDTVDTAFVIFAVVIGMSMGAGQPLVALLGGTCAVAAIACGVWWRPNLGIPTRRMLFEIKMAWSPELEADVLQRLASHHISLEPIAAATVKQGAAVELEYRARIPHGVSLPGLLDEINRLEGVHNAELSLQKDEDR